MQFRIPSAIALFALPVLAGVADATPIAGGSIYATGGNVYVDVLGSDSGYRNEIGLFDRDLGLWTAIGADDALTTVALGPLTAGVELVFGILAPTGHTYVTGPGARNPDSIVHGWIEAIDLAGFASTFVVRFEDLLGGGDSDFNDAVLRVRQTAAVPEPGTLALIGIGLVAVGLLRKRHG